MAKTKDKIKKYHLEICYKSDVNDQIEYIKEYIEDDRVSYYYGDINIGRYFDGEGLDLLEGCIELGET